MRRLSRRERFLLAALLLGGLVYGWYAMRPRPASTSPNLEAQVAAAGPAMAPAVRMDLLARAVDPYDPEGRDLFQFAQRPPSAEELRRQREEEERVRRLQEEAARRQAQELEQQRAQMTQMAAATPPKPAGPQPPPLNMRYIGYLGPKDARIAAFNRGEEVVLARRGEVVGEEFKVLEIKYETVVVGYVRPEFKDLTRELTMGGP